MALYRYLRLRLREAGLLPASKVALIAWYLLGLDLLLFLLQKAFGLLKLSYGDSLGGWVSFLSFLVIVLFSILAFRWLKAKVLWRLRRDSSGLAGCTGSGFVLLVCRTVRYLHCDDGSEFRVEQFIRRQLRNCPPPFHPDTTRTGHMDGFVGKPAPDRQALGPSANLRLAGPEDGAQQFANRNRGAGASTLSEDSFSRRGARSRQTFLAGARDRAA